MSQYVTNMIFISIFVLMVGRILELESLLSLCWEYKDIKGVITPFVFGVLVSHSDV